jgi:hypothetical protein
MEFFGGKYGLHFHKLFTLIPEDGGRIWLQNIYSTALFLCSAVRKFESLEKGTHLDEIILVIFSF